MNEYLNAEEFETLRKKQLYELQQAAADRDKTRAWRMVFMKRGRCTIIPIRNTFGFQCSRMNPWLSWWPGMSEAAQKLCER